MNTELDALLSRVREDKADPTGKNRNAVVYDCWRMFEDLATRYKEEFAMRDRYKVRSNSWRDKAFELADETQIAKLTKAMPIPCWRCGGSGQRSAAETMNSPGDHPCPACKPISGDAIAQHIEPGPVEYAKVKRALDQIGAALKHHRLELVVGPDGDYDVVEL